MRHSVKAILISVLLCVITGCGATSVQPSLADSAPAKLIFATDMHFYAPELVGDFARFSEELERGDGKLAQYSSELIDTLVDTVLLEKPDALMLGGDLTLNGEYESHRRLADKLKAVYDAGIPVLVVPGNHDINNLGAYNYAESDSCASIDENGFGELYNPLGADGAVSRDKESLSYLYALRKDLYLLMLDSCDYDGFGRSTGSVSEKTMKWIERELKAARKAGAAVISVSHHNLLQHSPRFEEPYVMHDNEALVALLERYNVKLNLTGHIHIQHILQSETEGGLTEAVTGAMSVSPNYYAALEIGADQSISYAVKRLDVAGWAKKNGSTNKDLLDFVHFSQAFFDTTNSQRIIARLESQQLSGEELEQAADFSRLVNRNYFAGTVGEARDQILQHPGYTDSGYMGSALSDLSAVHTSVVLQ